MSLQDRNTRRDNESKEQFCDNNNKSKKRAKSVKVSVSLESMDEDESCQHNEVASRSNRALLTSDYDSSNDSTCDAQATVTDVNVSYYIKGPCLLCGRQARPSLDSIHRRIAYSSRPDIKKVSCWPNTDAPPPVPPRFDSFGRIVVKDGQAYDLEELTVDPLLNLITEWNYPIFELREASGDAILSEMSYKIFYETGLLEAFKIPVQEFLNFFRALECGYKENPYHNRTHAADVLHGVYFLTSQPIPGFDQIPTNSTESPLLKTSPSVGSLPQSYLRHISVCEDTYGIMGANFPALELLALYTAAAMHDYDHPGRTNAFLVSSFAPQALMYNDKSVLENYHAATAWTLFFSDPEYNWLRCLDRTEFKRFRLLVIELILATDLKRHFDILDEFNAKVKEGIDWLSETDRLLVMEMVIKLADINGPCKRQDIHLKWTQRISEEFYEQGDDEARLGMTISPFMDRKNPQVAKLQESFISHLVAPLCNCYAEAGLLPGLWQYIPNQNEGDADIFDGSKNRRSTRRVVCLQTKHLQENYETWVREVQKEEKRSKSQKESSKKSMGLTSDSNGGSSDDSSTIILANAVKEQDCTETDEECT